MKSRTELDTRLTRLHRATVRRRDRARADAPEKDPMRAADYVSALAAAGRTHRRRTCMGRARPRAKVASLRTLAEFDFIWPTSAPPSRLGSCLGPAWRRQGRSLILYGPAGSGPTYRAMAYRTRARGGAAYVRTAAQGMERLVTAGPVGKRHAARHRLGPECQRATRPRADAKRGFGSEYVIEFLQEKIA